jgi:competence CoiA-like predicted nuclease
MSYSEESDYGYDNPNIKLVARKYSDFQKIHAREATKEDGPFFCPETYEDVIVRKCVEKVDHFAYSARLSPVIGRGESELHYQCKEEICQLLSAKFPDGKWETERPIKAKPEKGLKRVVPDISGNMNGQRFVIEVQASTLSLGKIRERTLQYTRRGVPILWVVPLKEELGDEQFRPRIYEHFFHSMYYGRTYYWTQGSGLKVKPVHYGDTGRDIEYKVIYDEYGEEQEFGGYFKTYKNIKVPNYGKELDISKDFKLCNRSRFYPSNERKAVPDCLTFQDRLTKWW